MYIYWDSYRGLSREEVLQKTWDERLTPEDQARVLKVAAERGITYMDILRYVAETYDHAMKDPAKREEFRQISAEMDQRLVAPYEPDPLLRLDVP